MGIKEFLFKYDELTLDQMGIHAVLGYPGSPLPAPFDSYLEEALEFASGLTEIRAICRIIEPVRLEPSKGSVHADGRSFLVGKTVCKELRNSEKLLFFVCTAGKSISDKSAELLKGDDPAKGYIYDQVGTFLTEAAGDRMQQLVLAGLVDRDELITNRYSPGYCHWDVADQHLLFSLFPPAPCGVTLTSSALMHPVKSISGVIGIGKAVNYRDYPCALCQSLNCIYRKIHS
jgi:hypothetical protein